MSAAARMRIKRNADRSLLEQRIDYARFLLTQTAVPLEKIAADCGWQSEKAFASVFENRVGVTPRRYRNWHQCQPDAAR